MARQRNRRRIPMRHPLTGAVLLGLATSAQAQNLPEIRPGEDAQRGAQVMPVSTNPHVSDLADNYLEIVQRDSRAVLHWENFSIAQHHMVEFKQPGADSIALNRVLGGQPSEIMGALKANGHVFLINPNGVLFGATAQVDVGGLVASTLLVDEGAFLGGTSSSFVFQRDDVASGGILVMPEATIKTTGSSGLIALLGDTVRNQGSIEADRGSIVMGGGETVTLDIGGDGLTNLAIVTPLEEGNRVWNQGDLQADGGYVGLHAAARQGAGVIYQDGAIRARSLQSRRGRIVLSGGYEETTDNGDTRFAATGRVEVIGTQDASAGEAGAAGGEILVEAGRILVLDPSSLDPTAPSLAHTIFNAGGNGNANGQLHLLAHSDVEVTNLDRMFYGFNNAFSYVQDTVIGATLGNDTDVVVTAGPRFDSDTWGRLWIVGHAPDANGGGDPVIPAVIEKTRGSDAKLTFNANRDVVVRQARIGATAGRLDIDLNADMTGYRPDGDGFGGSYYGGGIWIDSARISSNGGDIRLFGQSDPEQGRASRLLMDRDFLADSDGLPIMSGIVLDNVVLDACGVAANGGCGAADGEILLRGQGEFLPGFGMDLNVLAGAQGIRVTGESLLRSSSGDIRLDGVGGAGESGVVLRSEGDDRTVRIQSSHGHVSILGVAGDEPVIDPTISDEFHLASAGPGVLLQGVLVDAGGGIGIEGRGGDLSPSLSADRPLLQIGFTGGVAIENSALRAGDGQQVRIAGEAGSQTLYRISDDILLTIPSVGVSISDATIHSASGLVEIRGLDTDRGFVSDLYLQADIDVGSASGRGGDILVSGPNMRLGPVSTWRAAGGQAGGRIDVEVSGVAEFDPHTFLDASATGDGDGGLVRLFGAAGLRALGSLSARGAGSGDGGLIETSGGGLDLRGIAIDASAPNGMAGTWLIDPYDVYIVHGSADGSLPSNPFEPLSDAIIQDGDINNALDAGTSVQITTGDPGTGDSNGDIVFSADYGLVRIARTDGDAELTFRLDANRAIRTEGYENGSWIEGFTIDGGDGPLNVLFNADANGTVDPGSEDAGIHLVNAEILSRGGNVWFYGQGDPVDGLATGEAGGIGLATSRIDTRGAAGNDGEVRLRGYGGSAGVALLGSTIDSGTGSQHLFGRNLFSGSGVLLAGWSDGSDVVRSRLHAEGGDIRIIGLAANGSGTQHGVYIEHAGVSNEGGSIDILGRAFALFDPSHLQQAYGISVSEAAAIGNAGATRVRLVAEAAGDGAIRTGLRFGDSAGCGLADGVCIRGQDVVLQASASGGAPAIALNGPGTVAASGVVNLRPGGVDAAGNAYERPDDAIVLGAGGGFALSQALFDRLETPDLVIGSDLQAASIDVQQAVQRAGNLTLQSGAASAAGITIGAGIDVDGHALALVSGGDVTQAASGQIVAESLLARSTGGDVLLAGAVNDVSGNTLAGGAAGRFEYLDADALAVGTVDAVGFSAGGNAPQSLSAAGIDAGNDVFVQNLDGDLTLAAGIGAGNDITLVTAGRLQNTGAASLDAGNLWRVWADTWVGETRGGLAGSGPLPNLYNCAHGGSPACGVAASISASDSQFIYAQQPTATVAIGSHAREYGLANPALAYGVSGIILDDIAANVILGSASTGATIQSNVGQYPIVGSFTSPAGYAINVLPGVLDITRATLLYVANPYSRIYGDPEGALTGTVTGFRNDDTLADATTGTLAFGSGTGLTTGVGTYAITGGGLDALNYRFEQAPGNATAYRIDPATLWYVADPYSRIYGDPEGVLTGTVTGFRNDDSLANATTGTLVFSSGTGLTTGVGTYAITGGGLSASNYVFAPAPGNASAYRIDPATLWYVADPYSRQVGQPNGVLTGTVTGFRNDDTLAGATTGTLVFTSPADQYSPVGVYAIDGGGLDAANYVFAQAPDNATAMTVFGLSSTLFPSDLVREPQDNYLYDRNIGAAPMCPILADMMRMDESDEEDVLAREWSRVKTRPNLTNCFQGNRRNGCDDF